MSASVKGNREIIARNFRLACAIAEITMAQFARTQGITRGALANALSGRITSKRIMQAVRQFTDEQARRAAVVLTSMKTK